MYYNELLRISSAFSKSLTKYATYDNMSSFSSSSSISLMCNFFMIIFLSLILLSCVSGILAIVSVSKISNSSIIKGFIYVDTLGLLSRILYIVGDKSLCVDCCLSF